MTDAMMRESESLPVQLTRIEGTINLIKYQNDDMVKRVGHLEGITAKIQAEVQKLQLEAVARDATSAAISISLEKASKARDEESDRAWSPVSKLVTVVVAIGVIVDVVVQIWFR